MSKAEKQAKEWNDRHPVGTPVAVTQDNGSIVTSKTRSEAWVMGGHTAVVMYEGRSGGYLLSRFRALDGDKHE